MNIKIYSRQAMETYLKHNHLDNTAVISFYDPPNRKTYEGNTPVDYADKCDRVFPVELHDIDRSVLMDFGLTYDTYFPEVDRLAEFIYQATEDGLDIICQCQYGQSRSAACAAAILEHFEGNGISVFVDDRYYPNQMVYRKVFNALERVKKKKAALVPDDLISKAEAGKKQIEDFKKAVAPAIAWYKKNCDQHQVIVISDGMARLVSDDMGVPIREE